MKTIGERHWTAGPILIAPKRVHARLVTSSTDVDGRARRLAEESGIIGEASMTAAFRLKPGRYAVDSVWSYEAEVKVGKRVEDTMIAVLRLRAA